MYSTMRFGILTHFLRRKLGSVSSHMQMLLCYAHLQRTSA